MHGPSARCTASLTPAVQPAAAPRPAAVASRHGCQWVPRSAGAACRRRPPLCAQAAPSSGEAAPAAAAADVSASLEVLLQACRTKQVPPDEVLAAMERVEAAHRQQPQVQGFPAALGGTWRLVFSAPSPIKAWQYIPVLEDAVIDVERGTIDLVSVVGPLDNAFKGTCTFEQDPATGAYVMRFGFSATESTWFGRWRTKSEVAEKRKSYTFFLLNGDLAAANSSGGPKTLMFRVK